MTNDEPISVAQMRKDLGDILSRAHYQDQRVTIAKRDKPFAFVGSLKAKARLDDFGRLATLLHLKEDELMERLTSALDDEQRRSALKKVCGP